MKSNIIKYFWWYRFDTNIGLGQPSQLCRKQIIVSKVCSVFIDQTIMKVIRHRQDIQQGKKVAAAAQIW